MSVFLGSPSAFGLVLPVWAATGKPEAPAPPHPRRGGAAGGGGGSAAGGPGAGAAAAAPLGALQSKPRTFGLPGGAVGLSGGRPCWGVGLLGGGEGGRLVVDSPFFSTSQQHVHSLVK